MIGISFFSEKVQTKNGLKEHLFVIIAEKDGIFLAVPVTSWSDNRYCNPECLLNIGDHPFIKHKSWIDFSKARTYTYSEIFNNIKRGIFRRAENFEKEKVDYIIARAQNSEDLPEKFLDFFS